MSLRVITENKANFVVLNKLCGQDEENRPLREGSESMITIGGLFLVIWPLLWGFLLQITFLFLGLRLVGFYSPHFSLLQTHSFTFPFYGFCTYGPIVYVPLSVQAVINIHLYPNL
jgi:hypothetical protein